MGATKFWSVSFLVAAAVLVLTRGLIGNEYFFFAGYVVLQYIVLSTAWNILGGYTGYTNFGVGAFFAVGAYSSVVLHKLTSLPVPVMILVGGLMSGILGFGMGYLTLRIQGVFFSIATLALTIVLSTIVVNWSYIGGARGATVLAPPPVWFPSIVSYVFFATLLMAVITVAVARWIERSWVWRGLAALRADEQAAECCGTPTLKLKLFAATVSGALIATAGAPYPYYASYVEPGSAFGLTVALNALAMPLIGGTRSWIGPVIGALLLSSIEQAATVTIPTEVNLLIVGLVLIGFVVVAPDGLLGLFARRRFQGAPT